MKRYVLALSLMAALFAQKPKDSVAACHRSGDHPCHCMERTNKIQNAAAEMCNSDKWKEHYKSVSECYADKLANMDHCSIAERWTDYDAESGSSEQIDGREVAASTMGPMCSMACARHHCMCDGDGPMCHFGETDDQIRDEYKRK